MPPAETSRHPRTHPVRLTAFDLGSRPPATAHVAEDPLRAYPAPLGDAGRPHPFGPVRPSTFASRSGVCATSAYQCLPLPVAGAPSALRLLASRAGPAVILQRRASRQLPDTPSARRRQLRPRPPRRCGLRSSPASALRHRRLCPGLRQFTSHVRRRLRQHPLHQRNLLGPSGFNPMPHSNVPTPARLAASGDLASLMALRLAALVAGAVHVRVVGAGFASSSLPVTPFMFTTLPTLTAMSCPLR